MSDLYHHYRILICGSQKWTKRKIIKDAIYTWLAEQTHDDDQPSAVTLIHGGAAGADAWASAIAHADGLSEQVTPAIKGAAKGNLWMPSFAHVCLGFPLGASTHTRTVMALAEKAGIPVINHGDQEVKAA